MPKNIVFSFKKVKKTYCFGQPRGGGGPGGGDKRPLLPSTADAHDSSVFNPLTEQEIQKYIFSK